MSLVSLASDTRADPVCMRRVHALLDGGSIGLSYVTISTTFVSRRCCRPLSQIGKFAIFPSWMVVRLFRFGKLAVIVSRPFKTLMIPSLLV